MVLVVPASGCSWQDPVLAPAESGAGRAPGPPVAAGPATNARATYAAEIALRQVGTPYRFGGASPRGFDCSGLVNYAYAAAGVRLPRTTAGLWRDVRRVGAARAPGDLLFFRIDGKLSHVAIYVGGGQFVHAPSTGSRVRVERIDDPFYSARLAGVGRPLP